MTINKLFVYGTLRKGRIDLQFPELSPYIKVSGKGSVSGLLFDAGDYPGAIPDTEGAARISGDVLEVNSLLLEHVLKVLDEYEEYDKKKPSSSLFKRHLTTVHTEKGGKTKAWIYWYNKPVKGLKQIKSGVFRKRKKVLA